MEAGGSDEEALMSPLCERVFRLMGHKLLRIELVRPKATVEDSTGQPRSVIVRCARGDSTFWGDGKDKFESEAEAMRFARAKFQGEFHVPQVLWSGVDEETQLPVLAMELIDAPTLRSFIRGATDTEVDVIAQLVMRAIELMLATDPPFTHVGSFCGHGLMYDGPTLKPADTWIEFVAEQLVWSASRAPQHIANTLHKVLESGVCSKALGTQKARLVFRHGDLSVDNILVLEGGQRIALIDWEWSGFVDERDVWLEARELFIALDRVNLWKQHMPFDSLRAFEDVKEVAMGVAFSLAVAEADREEELECLQDAIAALLRI